MAKKDTPECLPDYKKGGKAKKVVKKAAGGVGKIRHEQATKSGKALSRAEFDRKRI